MDMFYSYMDIADECSSFVHTVPHSFCAGSKTTSDRSSVHTQNACSGTNSVSKLERCMSILVRDVELFVQQIKKTRLFQKQSKEKKICERRKTIIHFMCTLNKNLYRLLLAGFYCVKRNYIKMKSRRLKV